jgi:subtilase family serine protease
MNRRIVQVLPILAIAALAACSNGGMNPALVQSNAPLAQTGDGDVPFRTIDPVRQMCPEPGTPERMQCFASVRTDVMPTELFSAQASPGAEGPCQFSLGYCPIDLQNAYDLPSLTKGTGKTVAIVDAYGYDHAASDLAIFRKAMGLKPCGTATKCLRIVNQEGNPGPLPQEPPKSNDWRGEDSLDLDMVSGICPNCKIIFIEANNDFTTNLYAGVKTAGVLGAKYIGVSWGSGPEGADDSIFHIAGAVIAAAAGDNGGGGRYGGGPIQPCTYSHVICVGGTHLVRDSHNKRGWSETVWNDWTLDQCGNGHSPCGATGSGCSKKIAKPAWQNDTGCHMRSAADTSATASLRAPVIVYNSEIGNGGCPQNCYWLFGGTSASTQIIIGVFALAGNAANQMGGTWLWKHHSGNVNDVTLGNNLDANIGVTCASGVQYICTARAGFDGPTGWGSPNGLGAF